MAAIAPSTLQLEAERLAGALPPLLVDVRRIAETVAQGAQGRRRVGPGEAFWQFRPYVAGDRPHLGRAGQGPQRGRGRLERVVAARGEDEVDALARQRLGATAAQPLAGRADQGPAAGDAHVHVAIRSVVEAAVRRLR